MFGQEATRLTKEIWAWQTTQKGLSLSWVIKTMGEKCTFRLEDYANITLQ